MKIPEGHKNKFFNTAANAASFLRKLVPNWDSSRVYITGKWDRGGSKMILPKKDGTLLIIGTPLSSTEAYYTANRMIHYFNTGWYDDQLYIEVYGPGSENMTGLFGFVNEQHFQDWAVKVRTQYSKVGFRKVDRPDEQQKLVNE